MPDVRTELQVYGSKHPYTLVVEPWASEFTINPGEQCRVIAIHETEPAVFGVEHHGNYLVVWVNRGGATFEFWRGDKQEM
jgi:hypothetical protein